MKLHGGRPSATFKLRGWPPRNVAGVPKVQKTAGRERTLIGQSLSNAGLGKGMGTPVRVCNI